MKSISMKLGWLALLLLWMAAAWIRFADLGRSATRSDEITFIHFNASENELVKMWKNPPWQNQMPFADSIAVIWVKLQPWRKMDEGMAREPFALFGLLTMGMCVFWLWRKQGLWAAILASAWLGLLPFLVYHSREAYYYSVGMFFSTGMVLMTVALLEGLEQRKEPSVKSWMGWMAWVCAACLSHMAIWVLAGVLAMFLWAGGWKFLRGADRRHFFKVSVVVDGLILLFMSRWIWRAIVEIIKISSSPTLSHIGNPFGWMAPRILPVFFGGANAVGMGWLVVTLAAALWGWRGRRKAIEPAALGWLSRAVWLGFAATLLYVGVTGGGAGKWVYFSAVAPVLIVWAVCVWNRFWRVGGERTRAWGMAGCTLAVAATLAVPAWKVTQLDGKPTAYRQIQSWLDANLSPGDVAIVDRWFEPWNEMALYAPTNVTVSFTVPDEPYEQYINLNWRQVTKGVFEHNGAQAFIRLTRNYEQRMGLWTWPETWFRHRVEVANEAGRWLRDTGFAPMEEFYSASNRVVTEIFYDTHEDIAERAQSEGKAVVWFFGEGWRLFKPWQQGDFSDYRVMEGDAVLSVHNLRDTSIRVRGEVVAAASGGNQIARIGNLPPMTFLAGQLATKAFELDLPPGISQVPWKKLNQPGALLVRNLRLERME